MDDISFIVIVVYFLISFRLIDDKIRIAEGEIFFDFVKRDFFMTKLRFIYATKWVWRQVLKRSDLIRRSSILALVILASILTDKYFDISAVSQSISNYYISVGAMIGGILAIVFTLTLFAQQNASDLYSSEYFQEFTYDWKQKLIYLLIIVICIGFFVIGVYFNTSGDLISITFSKIIFTISLISLGLVFVLIDWHFKNVMSKINPIEAINFIEQKIVRLLNSLHKDATRIASVLKLSNKNLSDSSALGTSYNQFLKNPLINVDRKIGNLFEIVLKLSNKKEVNSVNLGLSAVMRILLKYLEFRKDSSTIRPSSINFLAMESDSQGFLVNSLEKFNNIGEMFIRERKIDNAKYIADIYRQMIISSAQVNFNRHGENPVLDLIKGYFGTYVNFAIKEKNLDVVFHSLHVYRDIAPHLVQKSLQLSLQNVHEMLSKIAFFGLAEKHLFLTDECYSIWNSTIVNIFYHRFFQANHEFSKIFENYNRITIFVKLSIDSGVIPNDFSAKTTLAKPFNDLIISLSYINNYFFDLTDDEKRDDYRSILNDFFEELNSNLRDLAKTIKTSDGILIDAIGRLIFEVNMFILRLITYDTDEQFKNELEEHLVWYIHLPSHFTHNSKSIDGGYVGFWTLAETITKTGIILFKEGKTNLINDCIKALYSMVNQALEKLTDKHGYDEPRMVEKICYFGILALKNNMQELLTDVGIKIYEFEEKYNIKYFENVQLPKGYTWDQVMGVKPDQLFREVLNWRGDFEHEQHNRHALRDDASDLMFDLIEEADIDWFIFEIWGIIPSHSSVENEIKGKVEEKVKKQYIIRLTKVLKSMFLVESAAA